jgi:hypothetical protein
MVARAYQMPGKMPGILLQRLKEWGLALHDAVPGPILFFYCPLATRHFPSRRLPTYLLSQFR